MFKIFEHLKPEYILNKLGYIREDKITPDYILDITSKSIGDPTEYGITKEIEEKFFKDLSYVENINKFLNATLAADMQREFATTEEKQRNLVKGAFSRTLYFKNGIIKANKSKQV